MSCWTDGLALSAKRQLAYNKAEGQNRRGRNQGTQRGQEVAQEAEEGVWVEVWDEVRKDVQEESEDYGVQMVHLIDKKLEEVRRKVARTDVMVWAMVRQGIGRWSQDTLERFVEGLDDKELEDLGSLEGIDKQFIVKMRRLEKAADEVQREWFEGVTKLDDREEGEAEEREEEEEVQSEGEGVRSPKESKYSMEVDYEELDRTDREGEVDAEM